MAIESKMVRQQDAMKAKFAQQQAEIEASTTVIRARGEAGAINAKGQSLAQNPEFISLQIVEQWKGKTPLVVGEGVTGAEMLLPLASKEIKLQK
jgi:predicted TIM-barrel enzyme